MKPNNRRNLKSRFLTTLLIFVVGALAWISTQYPVRFDITANNSNTLSAPSQQLLQRLTGPVKITAYIKTGLPLRNQLSDLIERYRRIKPDITFAFVDPASQPAQIRALDIGTEGAVMVEYQNRSEKITFVNETSLSNALLQLLSSESHWLSFLTGHGERNPIGTANFDLGEFGKHLKKHQYTAQPLNLATLPEVPENSACLIITVPTVALLANELTVIHHYIQQGGNLLILAEPEPDLIKPLLDQLDVQIIPGTVVDNQASLHGLSNATFTLVSRYETPHTITRNLETMTLFPGAAALVKTADSLYESVKLINSSEQAWNETGELANVINFNAENGEQMGPLTIGLAMTRKVGEKQQRIVVMGDGDFLSNAYIHNVGNLDLGLRLIKWLSQDDNMIDIPARMAPDARLQLSPLSVAVIGFGFLLILPLFLIICGWWIWRQRKRR